MQVLQMRVRIHARQTLSEQKRVSTSSYLGLQPFGQVVHSA